VGGKGGKHYFLKFDAHVAIEKLYFTKGSKIVLQQIIHGAVQFLHKKKKILQFSLITHSLSHSHPMTKYIAM
jgi:hypothetical protein